MRRLAKTGSYWVVHITVAVSVAWALTGNLKAAMAIGLIEPTVQAFVYFFHEWVWEHKVPVRADLDQTVSADPAFARSAM